MLLDWIQITKMKLALRQILWVCCTCWLSAGYSQCTTAIPNFPYVEDFEQNNGNWVVGGNAADWAWGTPTKPVINSAGSGTKCWITGGLTASFYSNAQNSWLQSPCFDLSTLSNPQISFKVFWETERRYDGASLQYSINNGSTWQALGGINSNNDCNGINWFNTTSITTLNYAGWSGNIQPTSPCAGGAGSGSGTWLVAKHNLAFLAGQTGVLFRFTFAAGTQCNAYDGFAIDSISISDTPPNATSLTYNCAGNKAVNFSSITSPCAMSYNWDFGDVASGTANFSAAQNPAHIFSSSGTYNVTLQVAYAGNLLVSTNQTITVLAVDATVINPILCNGTSTGAIAASAAGGTGNYSFVWNTNPPQTTSTINGLQAGTYAVTVSAINACSTTDSVVLVQPPAINYTSTITNVLCVVKGAIAITATGGTAPYQYLWNNGATTAQINNLNAGFYNLKITDANNCSIISSSIRVDSMSNVLQPNLGRDTSFCSGNLLLSPGVFGAYRWQDNTTSTNYLVSQTGKYWVRVFDVNGCTAIDTIAVTIDCSGIFFPSAFTPNRDFKNDGFGPLGNLAAVNNYQLRVYNRWGQVVFFSTNPYAEWDGKINGRDADIGTFIWTASFAINNQPIENRKGTVTLIR